MIVFNMEKSCSETDYTLPFATKEDDVLYYYYFDDYHNTYMCLSLIGNKIVGCYNSFAELISEISDGEQLVDLEINVSLSK